jgi:tetratricopeptide (TPR) repeat protein
MAVYLPRSETGVAHYSSFSDAPFKMVHSWGGDARAADWRHALSDDSSSYVEIQAGLFRNRETYGFLEPEDRLSFTEYWIPLRGIGGLTRATPEAALRVSRVAESTGLALDIALNVTHAMPNARVELRSGARVLESEGMALSPEQTLLRRWTIARGSPPLTVSVRDGRSLVIQHTEGVFDFASDSLIRTGAQPVRQAQPAASRSAADWVDDAEEKEMGGDYAGALESYCLALALKPQSAAILRSAGRLAITMRRFRMADSLLQRAWSQTSNDPEAAYYLALSRLAVGDTVRARPLLNIARRSRAVQTAANLSLATLDAQAGIFRAALDHLNEGLANAPGASRLLSASAVLLRALGDSAATAMLDRALTVSPLGLLARYERMRATSPDTALLAHLASDPERILTVATDYMDFGLYDAALEVLERPYPATGLVADAGTPHPSQYPLIAYYRGYVKERLGRSPAADYVAASKMSALYVFPSRDEDSRVLKSALAFNAKDALGHLLLGHLAMASDDVDAAIEHWERARSLNAKMPGLQRNLGLAYLLKGEPSSAQRVLTEGLRYDSLNAAIYLALDSLAESRHQALEARIRSLSRYPAKSAMPSPLVFRLAKLLAAAGQFDAAESLFKGRYFAHSAVGENATSVWMEVRVARAEQLAKSGKCSEGMQMLTSVVRPVDGVGFRSEALVAEVSRAPIADWSARLLQQCASATGAGPRTKSMKVSETPRPPGTRK